MYINNNCATFKGGSLHHFVFPKYEITEITFVVENSQMTFIDSAKGTVITTNTYSFRTMKNIISIQTDKIILMNIFPTLYVCYMLSGMLYTTYTTLFI